jgi:hypothetical protein
LVVYVIVLVYIIVVGNIVRINVGCIIDRILL